LRSELLNALNERTEHDNCGFSKEQIVAECTATLKDEYNKRLKIFTDGSLKDERVGYAIVTPEITIKNRMRSQTTIFSAEQEAIIKAIYISKGEGATVIATDSLSTIMVVEGTRWTKNPDEMNNFTKKKERSN
jgi:ribonuclease HI